MNGLKKQCMIKKRSGSEIATIRRACLIASDVLYRAKKKIKPGVSILSIDKYIEEEIIRNGAKPAFKGYRGYRHASCLSINEEIVHGVPKERFLKEGDIIGVDIGTIVDGYYGDVAATFSVGSISESTKNLLSTTERCLELGINAAKSGGHIGDISSEIEKCAFEQGYSVVRDLFGHGVGESLHEDPLVPNFGKRGEGPLLEDGMVFAIEPMVNIGKSEIETLNDGWTVVTKDRSLSAHFEHTIAINGDKPLILTKR